MAPFEAKKDFKLATAPPQVWTFFNDIRNIAACIPGSRDIQTVSGETVGVTLVLKVGYISRSFRVRARITDRVEASRLRFLGESEDANFTGEIELKPTTDGGTAVNYQLRVEPLSGIAKTAATLLGDSFVQNQTKEFANCVQQKLSQ